MPDMPDMPAQAAERANLPLPADGAPTLVEVVRGHEVESAHTGHLVVVDQAGNVLASLGRPDLLCFPRSALKLVQASVVLEIANEHGAALDSRAWAIASASHIGTDDQQIEAARLLALADASEVALQCPPAWPNDLASLRSADIPTRLAHNCSGKHAGFVFAQRRLGGKLSEYLDPKGPLQERIAHTLAAYAKVQLAPPAIDGCGAPAWLLPLDRLAHIYVRAASGQLPPLAHICAAMRTYPELVGGRELHDTMLMREDARVIAKRGAEGVFAVGTTHGYGIALKITDGDSRAVGPVIAAVLQALGLKVPQAMLAPPVHGGEAVHGSIRITPFVEQMLARLA